MSTHTKRRMTQFPRICKMADMQNIYIILHSPFSAHAYRIREVDDNENMDCVVQCCHVANVILWRRR